MSARRYEKFFEFEKVDEGAGIVYGWAIVCTINGDPYIDLQGDHIPVAAMLDATASFMSKGDRPGLDMHDGDPRGDIVFGMPITKQTQSQLGMTTDREGFYIGWKPRDEAAMALVKSGERLGFSIGGWIEEADDVDVAKNLFGRVKAQPDRERLAKAKNKSGSKPEKYRMFARFHLDEISIVDRPAQEGAKIGFVKRHVVRTAIGKQAVMTSSDRGHQHLVDPSKCDADGTGWTTSAEMLTSSGPAWHSHDWIRDPITGKITILDNLGHGHSVGDDVIATPPKTENNGVPDATAATAYVTANDKSAPENKNPANDSLTAKNTTPSVTHKSATLENAMTPEQIAELNARLAKYQALSEMNDAQKAHLAKLSLGEAESFIKSAPSERAAILKADEVVYTATDNTVFRKSDDPRLVASVKRADDMEKRMALSEVARKRAEFSKAAAEEMNLFAGDSATHAAILEAIESGISDETLRKSARDAIKGANAMIAKGALGKGNGTRGAVNKDAGAPQDPHKPGASNADAIEKNLHDKVEEYRKANKCPSYENALSKATLHDAEVRQLYNDLEEARADERN